MSYPFTLPKGTSPVEQQSALATPPVPVPKQSPRPKRWHPSPDPVDSTPLGGTMSKATLEGPPAPNGKMSHLGTGCSSRATQKHSAGTPDFVKEAREEYFSKHSYNFTMEGTCNLSEVFNWMAKSTKLLGTSMHKIQVVWMGPD